MRHRQEAPHRAILREMQCGTGSVRPRQLLPHSRRQREFYPRHQSVEDEIQTAADVAASRQIQQQVRLAGTITTLPEIIFNCFRTEKEKSISADYSALVNKAYNSLQAPLSRAIHLLKLKNVAIDEDQKISDPEFLTEIMELNEEVIRFDCFA